MRLFAVSLFMLLANSGFAQEDTSSLGFAVRILEDYAMDLNDFLVMPHHPVLDSVAEVLDSYIVKAKASYYEDLEAQVPEGESLEGKEGLLFA
jgi:hypothetical protein